ncbi:MAG: helix-turn-helix transcriptional regulator [Actinoplanes sp.]
MPGRRPRLSGDASAGAADQSEPPIGATLHGLRRQAGLTGQELGRRVNMSQAKISRMETGSTAASPEDVSLVARALGAPSEVVSRLVERAERAQNRMTDWRQAGSMVVNIQRDIGRLETGINEVRVFQPTVVIGLLQTSEYARTILAITYKTRAGIYREGGAEAVSEALSQRVQRQEALADPRRQFFFVMTEAVFRNRLVAPEHMLAQLDRIRQVIELPNVSLRIIPAEATLGIPPYHGFEVLDDKRVLVDIFNTSLVAPGKEDVQYYRHVFDLLEANATEYFDAILDRYRRRYLDQIRDST